MPIARVMVNGRVARVEVPEGTTPEQAVAIAHRVAPKPTGNNRPTSFWRGVGETVGATASNAQSVMEYSNPLLYAARKLMQQPGWNERKAIAQRHSDAAPTRGSTAGQITGSLINPAMLVPGGPFVQGAAMSALASPNAGDNPIGFATDTLLGGILGKGGQMVGRGLGKAAVAAAPKVLTPQAIAAGANASLGRPAGVAANQTGQAFARDRISRALKPRDVAKARRNVVDAERLGMPYTLADASPQTRRLAGSASRFSPDVQASAESQLGARSMGQADRAVQAIDTHLSPVTDIEQRAADIRKGASTAAQPYYDAAYSQPAPIDENLMEIMRRPAAKNALRNAYVIAQNEGRDPASLGLVIDDSGSVSLNDIVSNQAGRFASVKMPNEKIDLPHTVIRGWNGAEVNKVGPTDLVGWLRTQGGLADQGGELSHMGFNNAPRKMDFAGQEHKFGPLVNKDGMNLDDAAMRAWEAGYFPDLPDRPSVNQFLDAVRGTHEGWDRRFLPDDVPIVERFNALRDEKFGLQSQRFDEGAMPVRDTSYAAGADAPIAPTPVKEISVPTMRTLDYVKQGLDMELGKFRNPLTQKLNLEGDKGAQSVNNLLRDFKSTMDQISEPYKLARATYAENIAPRTALNTGYEILPKTSVPRRQFDTAVAGFNDVTLPEAQRGFATNMAETVDKARLSRNPYDTIYGSPLQQGKVGALFPEGAPDFGRTYQLEGDMAKTAQEVLGGSQTQPRAVYDAQFSSPMGESVANAGVQTIVGGPGAGMVSLLRDGARRMGDRYRLGMFGAQGKADKLGPALMDTDPKAILALLDQIALAPPLSRRLPPADPNILGLLGIVGAGQMNRPPN